MSFEKWLQKSLACLETECYAKQPIWLRKHSAGSTRWPNAVDRKLTLVLWKLKQTQQTQVNAMYYFQFYIHLICCFCFVVTLTVIVGLCKIYTHIPKTSSLTLGQTYVLPSAHKEIMKDMGKSTLTVIVGLCKIYTHIPPDFFTDTGANICFAQCP